MPRRSGHWVSVPVLFAEKQQVRLPSFQHSSIDRDDISDSASDQVALLDNFVTTLVLSTLSLKILQFLEPGMCVRSSLFMGTTLQRERCKHLPCGLFTFVAKIAPIRAFITSGYMIITEAPVKSANHHLPQYPAGYPADLDFALVEEIFCYFCPHSKMPIRFCLGFSPVRPLRTSHKSGVSRLSASPTSSLDVRQSRPLISRAHLVSRAETTAFSSKTPSIASWKASFFWFWRSALKDSPRSYLFWLTEFLYPSRSGFTFQQCSLSISALLRHSAGLKRSASALGFLADDFFSLDCMQLVCWSLWYFTILIFLSFRLLLSFPLCHYRPLRVRFVVLIFSSRLEAPSYFLVPGY